MKYSNAKLKALGDEPIPKDLEKLLFVTKFEHWNYEEELRAFIDLKTAICQRDLFFCAFGDDLRLRDVILGPLCVEDVEAVRTLVRATNPGARVSRSRPGFKYFEVKEHEDHRAK